MNFPFKLCGIIYSSRYFFGMFVALCVTSVPNLLSKYSLVFEIRLCISIEKKMHSAIHVESLKWSRSDVPGSFFFLVYLTVRSHTELNQANRAVAERY